MLADSVRDRVVFGTTSYRKSHDQIGRGWITIDGKEILNMPSLDFEIEVYGRRNLNATYEEMSKEVHDLNLFSQWDLQASLFACINLSIDEILASDNPLIRAMGMLDARLGKRRLVKLDVSDEHDLVKKLYLLRVSSEKIDHGHSPVEVTAALEQRWKDSKGHNPPAPQDQTTTILTRANRSRKMRPLISRIYRNEISREDLITDVSKALFDGFLNSSDPDTLYKIFLFVEARSKLLCSAEYVRGVWALSLDSGAWLRPLEEWKIDSHNSDRQFSSLARHLWARYDVPGFMDKAWLSGDSIQQEWFRALGAGGNIRKAGNLPVMLTQKMAHYFIQAPDTYSIDAAFRWAQVHALGGDRRLADALLETRIAHDFRDDVFWLGVIRFFIRNPMLDPLQVNPIIDYIWNQKYENRVVFTGPGIAEQIGPEQPDFSMKGRTAISLLKAVDIWHKRLGRERKSGNLQWHSSGIKPATYLEGAKKDRDMRVWNIRELLSSNELIAEGRGMKHCVASYANSCNSGTCSIWTMDLENEDGLNKLVTIEVTNGIRQIRQVRGKCNRLPTEKEKEIIRRWAGQEGLELASYI